MRVSAVRVFADTNRVLHVCSPYRRVECNTDQHSPVSCLVQMPKEAKPKVRILLPGHPSSISVPDTSCLLSPIIPMHIVTTVCFHHATSSLLMFWTSVLDRSFAHFACGYLFAQAYANFLFSARPPRRLRRLLVPQKAKRTRTHPSERSPHTCSSPKTGERESRPRTPTPASVKLESSLEPNGRSSTMRRRRYAYMRFTLTIIY